MLYEIKHTLRAEKIQNVLRPFNTDMNHVSCQISDLHVNSSQRYKNNKLVTNFVNTLLRSRYAVYHSSKHSFHFIRVDFFQHDVKGHQILSVKLKFQVHCFSRLRERLIFMRRR